MIKKYFTLAIALFLQMILINRVFGQLNFDETDQNYETNMMLINVLELLLMLVVNMAIIYNFLNRNLDKLTLYFVIGLSSVIILLYWFVYKTNFLSNYISRVDYNIDNEYGNYNNGGEFNNYLTNNLNDASSFTENIPNVTLQNNNNKNEIIFSKYHNKNTERDFTFENSYPNYNEIEPSMKESNNSNSNKKPDYSMYNGYDRGDVCYNCKCVEDDDGDKFCAKEIPGMGRIGCSERWECLNCKDCQTWDDDRFSQNNNNSNNNEDQRYTCQDCKCLETTAGRICGKVSRVDGFVQKCSSDCSKCDRCYGTSSKKRRSSNSSNLITVDPISNLRKVIVNNLKNSDLNKVLD
jgi:hypothetical protein